MHAHFTTCRCELNAVSHKVENELAITPFITEHRQEVVLVKWICQNRTLKYYSLKLSLPRQNVDATPDQFQTIEVLIDHLEGVVSQLCLVHQVIHQRLHHLSRASHILQRRSRLRGEDEQFVHHLCQILAFSKQYLDALVQFAMLSHLFAKRILLSLINSTDFVRLERNLMKRFGNSLGPDRTFVLGVTID